MDGLFMTVVLGLATLTLLLVTVLPVWRNPHWLVRSMDFPRLQFSSLALVLLLAQFWLLDLQRLSSWVAILVVLLCLAWQLWWILPFTPLWRHEVKPAVNGNPDRHIRILTSNILTSNRNAPALLELVHQHKPDVLVTLESDQWWQEQLDSLQQDMPYSIKCPLDNLYGMHVYSRLPLEETEIEYLVEDDVPSMHALLRLPTGDRVRMHFLHPAPPSPTENTESGARDAELVVVARSVADCPLPLIVTGDLNDVAWSPTTRLFRKVSGLLDPRVGRGMFNTFHADIPFLRWPLDHLFHSDHFTVQRLCRLPSIGSDHFPLFAELLYTPVKGRDQQGLQADAEDREWADTIVSSEAASKEDVPKPEQR